MDITDFSTPVRPPRAPPSTYPTVIPQFTFDITYAVPIPYQSPWPGSEELRRTWAINKFPRRSLDTGLTGTGIFKSSGKCVVVVLYNISTLGIPSVYHRYYGNFSRSFAGEMNRWGLPRDTTIGDQLPLHNPIPYDHYAEKVWKEVFNQIEAGWKTLLAVSSTAVLGCAVGFVQLLTACNSAMYRTVVLSAFILVWGSFVSGTYYIGRRDKFLSPRWMNNWKKATCNDYGFCTQIALPALLSAWAGILCIIAIVVVAVTGFCEDRVKLDGPLVASCTVVALVFIATIGLIWNAVKTINASTNMQ